MIVSPNSTHAFAKRSLGGKGYNLYLMSRNGLPVPSWVALSAQVFSEFRESTGIDLGIREILERAQRTGDYAKASESIRMIIVDAKMPQRLHTIIEKAYGALGCAEISVRSSAIDEDSATHSFAGQLSSFLYVEGIENVVRYVQECWASGYSERGLSYRVQAGINLEKGVDVAVVLQKMIRSEKSGVLFTVDPISQDSNTLVINSVYGVGEGLVSGALDADVFAVTKENLKVSSAELAKKESAFEKGGSGVTREVPVDPGLQDAPSLREEEIASLAQLGLAVERYYQRPQDIEWGIEEGKLYLLQSRPITTITRSFGGTLAVWDNSNIIESYGGITLPLTFTFARYVYREVYLQLCEILLLPKAAVAKLEYPLSNMLGSFYGRIYYNLLNWYRLLTILPGFSANRSFMETMMGVSQALSEEIAQQCHPDNSESWWRKRVRLSVTGLKFLYYHFRAQHVVDSFLSYFHAVYDRFRKVDYDRLPASEIYTQFRDLEAQMLKKWHAPIINDFLCMIHFGLLKKLTAKWLSSAGETLQNDLLCGEGNLESAEPTRELIRMAGIIAADRDLKALIQQTKPADCLEVIAQSPFTSFHHRVERFIDSFGFRCMSEMKLEQKDLHQDPTFLFVCLKNYLNSGQIDLEAYEKREKEIRQKAEATVKSHLSGFKLAMFLWSLKHARRAVRNRENTRFCRTRVYGIVRRMFYGWGNDYVGLGRLDRPEDVFYLTMDELKGTLDASCLVQDIRALVEVRKQAYQSYEALEPSARFITRGPVYWNNEHFPKEEEDTESGIELAPNQLKGTGCCPGIVEGRVKVILSPEDDMELNGEILVTQRTDPGWIPLYPSASGLLVQRGGLLSHSAIVAREMGLPTVVGVRDLIDRVRTGMRIRLDGKTGLVEILSEESPVAVKESGDVSLPVQ